MSRSLHRIPVFGALDRTGTATWKLCALLLLASVVLGVLLGRLPGPDVDAATARALEAMVLLDALLIGAAIATTLAIARTTEADLQQLLRLDPGVADAGRGFVPSPGLLGGCMLGYTMFVLAFYLAMLSWSEGWSLAEALSRMAGSGPRFFVLSFVMLPVTGVFLGIFLAVFVRQIVVLGQVAATMKIELWRVDQYASISNPAARFVLFAIAFLSVMPILGLYGESADFAAALLQLALAMLAVYVVVIAALLYPVLVLRDRIRERKLEEVDLVVRALEGHEGARAAIPPGVTDLVTYRMFLDGLWEWPVAAHVKKLLLFGLMLPFTWVLSAGLENSLF